MGRRRLARGIRIGLVGVLIVAGSAAALAVVLARTSAGRELALEWALDRLRSQLNGTIHVGSTGPGGSWGGATLHRVAIADAEGRTVAAADSIRARYSLRDLLGGGPAVADLRLWSPVVVHEPGPNGGSRLASVFASGSGAGEEDAAVADVQEEAAAAGVREALVGEAPGPVEDPEDAAAAGASGFAVHSEDAAAGASGFTVHGARIHDGAVVLRNADGDERRVEGIHAELASVALLPRPGTDFVADVDSLTVSYPLAEGRLEIAAAGAVVEGTTRDVALVAERVRLPSSVAAARATARQDAAGRWRLAMEVDEARSALADHAWVDAVAERLDGGLAQGVARGAWRLEAGPGGMALEAVDGGVEWPGGRVTLSGGIAWAGAASGSPSASGAKSFRFRRLRASGESVDARDAALWLSPGAAARLRETGARAVSGAVQLDGTPDSLHLTGSIALLHGADGDTLAVATGGGAVLGSLRSVRNLALDAVVSDFRLARALHPRFPWTGPGRVSVRATGDLPTGMTVQAQATRDAGRPSSPLRPPPAAPDAPLDSVSFAGILYGAGEVAVIEGEATVAPLVLSGLERLWPGLAGLGVSRFDAVRGTAAVSGPLERLRVTAELTTPAGPLAAEGQVGLGSPAVGYDLALSARDFRLSELAPRLPEPTVVSGAARLVGSGATLDSLRGALAVAAGPSTVGPVQVDTLDARVRVGGDGLLHVESLFAQAAGFRLQSDGGGSLALAPDAAGSAQGVVVGVSSSSPGPLGLRSLDPLARDVRFEGSVDGSLRLQGQLADMTAALSATAKEPRYGPHSAGTLKVEGEARGLRILAPRAAAVRPAPSDTAPPSALPTSTAPPSTVPPDAMPPAAVPTSVAPPSAAPWATLSGTVEATDSVVVGRRRFASVRVEGAYVLDGEAGSLDGAGRALAHVERSAGESYEAQAGVRVDGDRGRLDLDRLVLDFGEPRWNLQGPARFDWSPEAVRVQDFGLVRPGSGGLRLRADGRLALRDGDSDFGLEARGLDLALVGRLLQLEGLVEGVAQADLRVYGDANAPRWDGSARVEDAAWGSLRFDSASAEGRYARRTAQLRAGWWTGERRTLAVTGAVPLDLRFASADRLPDEPMDLQIGVDSFPLAAALAVVDGLTETSGTIAGDLRLRGTRSAPSPAGELRVENGAALVESLGVRLSSAQVQMDVGPDGKVRVDGSLESGGVVHVRGVVDAGQPLDPGFDLAFWPRGLQVVNRRDMEAAVTGDSIVLTGSYTAPFVEGALEVEGGTVHLEEFQRSAETLSFYDRSLFEAATDGAGPTALTVARNPFLANLRVAVEMHVGRGNWLRSQAMNIETEGDLTVTFDRQRNELVLYGAVEVVRGAYTGLPRPFAMTEGEFDFPGTPGFDPNVSVTAESRLRTRDGQPLVVTADISGPLRSLRLALSSDAGPGVTEGDIYSYLLTGRPESAGQGRVDAGVSLVVGRVVNQIGNLLAPQLSLDQFSVSQGEQSLAAATIGASSLQVEFGRYVRDNVFLKGVYQRGYCADPALPVNSGGARVEVEMPRDVTLEGFFENRCTREGFRGLGGLSLDQAWIWGLSFFREWGY